MSEATLPPRPNPLRLKREDGGIVTQMTVTSNEDHVANLIAEGDLPEADRWREIARLYRAQLNASNSRLFAAQNLIRDLHAQLRGVAP